MPDQTLTRLLQEARAGDIGALNQIVPMVYGELKQLARRQRRRDPGATLDTTALVNELFLKLRAMEQPAWDNRQHFFAAAAIAMRCLLVDSARRRLADKRGGGQIPSDQDVVDLGSADKASWILGLDQALSELAQVNPRLVSVVELRFLVGLSEQEVAKQLGVSRRTVVRDWRMARALLSEALSHEAIDPGPVAAGRKTI